MKKIFIMAYVRKNLGDDIFIKMLLEKYPNYDFYVKVHDVKLMDGFNQHKNLHVLIGPDTDEELYNSNPNDYNAYVYIGGSIFMEGGKVYNLSPKFYDFIERCKKQNIPFCYISSNYGPYQTKEYFELSRKTFNTCTDICFRDKYSYDLFKDIENVRYAPDYIFSYNLNKIQKQRNSIGISVIDFSIRPEFKEYEQVYYNWLLESVKQYIQEGYSIYLYSFCEYEGDEKIIDKLLNELKNEKNVKGIKYRGNIEEFLNLYIKMEYMICARFHAMVLSCIAEQKMHITSYSQKINNVIDDLELNLPILDFKDINYKMPILKLKDFKSVENEKVKKIKENAKRQDLVFEQKITELI